MKDHHLEEINNSQFKRNFISALEELSEAHHKNISDTCHYIIVPVIEPGKPYSTKDDIMRLIILSEDNLRKGDLNFTNTLRLLCVWYPLVPIWIDMCAKKVNSEVEVIELKTSLRMRKSDVLHNIETGHPPFKVIISE